MDYLNDKIVGFVVERLIADVNPQTIYLFGSRARGDAEPVSDYDFAVDCIDASDGVWATTCNWLREKKPSLHLIDLVRMDRAADGLKRRIHQEGIVLYSRKDRHERTL